MAIGCQREVKRGRAFFAAFERPGLYLGAMICLISLLAPLHLLPRIENRFFAWTQAFSPAVSYACGYPFGELINIRTYRLFETRSHPLIEFLERKRSHFDCAELPSSVPVMPLKEYAAGIPYYLRALGLYWRLTGVSWPALVPIMILLFAISNTLLFLIFKEFMGSVLAFFMSGLYAFSPVNYFSLSYFEHYAKVPLFLATIFLIVWLVRSCSSAKGLCAAATVGGVLIGVGLGVRADLWVLVIPIAATLLFFSKRTPAIKPKHRVLSCVTLLLLGLAIGWPAIMVEGASYFWRQLVAGLASPFNAELGIQPSFYEWLPRYNDNMAESWVQTYAYYQKGGGTPAGTEAFANETAPAGIDWQAVEQWGPEFFLAETGPGMDWQIREQAGRDAYLTIMTYFPADFLTRPLAAVLTILVRSFGAQASYISQFGVGPNFYTETAGFWQALAGSGIWVTPLLVVSLFILAVHDRRQALFFFILILFVGGLTAVAFLPRHRWHLYLIGFLTFGVALRFASFAIVWSFRASGSKLRLLPSLAEVRQSYSQPAKRAAVGSVAVVAVFAVVVLTAKYVQDIRVGRLVDSILAAEKKPVSIQTWSGTVTFNQLNDFVSRFRAQAAQIERFQYGRYFAATFVRDQCPTDGKVTLRHEAPDRFFDDSQTIPLQFPEGSTYMTLVFPAYYVKIGPYYGYFRGFEFETNTDHCLASVEEFRDPAALPFLITWRIPDLITWRIPEFWRDMVRHQSLIVPSRRAFQEPFL